MATVNVAVHIDENTAPQPENVKCVLDAAKLAEATVKPQQEQAVVRGEKRPRPDDSHVESNSTTATSSIPPSKRQRVSTWLVDSSTCIVTYARPRGVRAAVGAKELATKACVAGAQAGSLAWEKAAATGHRARPYAMQAAAALGKGAKGCARKASCASSIAFAACREAAIVLAQQVVAKVAAADAGAWLLTLAAADAGAKVEQHERFLDIAAESYSPAFSPPTDDGYGVLPSPLPSPEERPALREDGYEDDFSDGGSEASSLESSEEEEERPQTPGTDMLDDSEQDAGWMLMDAQPRVWQCPSSGDIYHFSREHGTWMPAADYVPDEGQWQ